LAALALIILYIVVDSCVCTVLHTHLVKFAHLSPHFSLPLDVLGGRRKGGASAPPNSRPPPFRTRGEKCGLVHAAGPPGRRRCIVYSIRTCPHPRGEGIAIPMQFI